jgi:hypothetical protein
VIHKDNAYRTSTGIAGNTLDCRKRPFFTPCRFGDMANHRFPRILQGQGGPKPSKHRGFSFGTSEARFGLASNKIFIYDRGFVSGGVLDVFWGCFGGVLDVFWGCSGEVAGVFRGCSGGVPGAFWGCSGGVPGVFWMCSGCVLGFLDVFWGCSGGVLGVFPGLPEHPQSLGTRRELCKSQAPRGNPTFGVTRQTRLCQTLVDSPRPAFSHTVKDTLGYRQDRGLQTTWTVDRRR